MIPEVETIRYRTINGCLAAFFRCRVEDLGKVVGRFEWTDADGVDYSKDVQEAIIGIRKRSTWGFVENKRTIHCFIRKGATEREIISLFAHEVGHLKRPYHKNRLEEKKAGTYAEVARCAYDMAMSVKKHMEDNMPKGYEKRKK